jgi:hypothetical protein
MIDFKQARENLLKPVIKEFIKEIQAKTSHLEFIVNYGSFKADTVLITEVYSKLQLSFYYNKINKIVASDDKTMFINKLYELTKGIHDLETEVYISTRETECPEIELDSLYSRMLPNSNIELFELIEDTLAEMRATV